MTETERRQADRRRSLSHLAMLRTHNPLAEIIAMFLYNLENATLDKDSRFSIYQVNTDFKEYVEFSILTRHPPAVLPKAHSPRLIRIFNRLGTKELSSESLLATVEFYRSEVNVASAFITITMIVEAVQQVLDFLLDDKLIPIPPKP